MNSFYRNRLYQRPQLTALEERLTPVNIANVLVNNPFTDTTSQDTQSETSTIVFGNTVLTAFNDSGNSSSTSHHFTGYARSTDGGATFTDLGSLPGNDDAGDPLLARDSVSGRIYLATLASGVNLNVFRSNDGGLTWLPPVNGSPGGGSDKDWITVDNFPGAGQGTVYTALYQSGIWFSRSTNGGTSFTTSIKVSTSGLGLVQGANLTIGPDHSVYVSWLDRVSSTNENRIVMRRSTDLGVTFGPEVIAANLTTTGIAGELGMGFRTNAFPQMVVNPINGDLYGVYNDKAGSDRGNIYFVQSADQGATWSAPVKVNDDTGTNDQFFPSVAVTPDGSKLIVSFYDRRLSASNSLIDYYAAPADISGGAVTFRSNQRITTQSFPAVYGVDPALGGSPSTYMGDYDIVNADNTNFYFVWSDNRDTSLARTGNQQNVRFAKTSNAASGPEVVSYTPSGLQSSAATQVNVFFNQTMDTSSFNLSDDLVSFAGPGGVDLSSAITGFNWPNSKQLQISMTSQSAGGIYSMVLGPNILSAVGVAMDDNLNGTPGETADRLAVSFQLTLPTNYVVDLATDEDDGNYSIGDLSLREVLKLANPATSSMDTITFSPTVFAAPQTLTLTLGQLLISDAVIINGPAARLTIDANKTSRHFNIDAPNKSNQTVRISGLTLMNGTATATGGGAILDNDEAVTLTGCTLMNNTTSFDGGAIYVTTATGSLTLTDCILSGNGATSGTSSGGAAYLRAGSVVSVTRCSITGNSAGSGGGGIYFFATGGNLTLTDTTVSGNKANLITTPVGGGGVRLFGQTAVIRNSTISGNSANGGGGILADSSSALTVQNTTVAFNTATTSGGGIGRAGSATISIASTVVGKNMAATGPDVAGPITSNFSLLSNTSGATITGSNNVTNVDPLINSLADNGGTTLTHRPIAGSPVINKGSNPANLANDQRGAGFPRVIGGSPDIGSVEGTGNIPSAFAASSMVMAGGTAETITVTYFDELAIDVSTLGTSDITVRGPNGFVAVPAFISVDVNSNGTPRVATYAFTPPDGSWDFWDNGAYTISMNANEVFDADSPTTHSVLASDLSIFSVSLVANYVVDLASDQDNGNYSAGDFSLREAIKLANAGPNVNGIDSISFSPSAFAMPTTQNLTLGQLSITDAVTIIGPVARLTIDANKQSRLFNIDVPNQSAQSVKITGLTLINGTATSIGGGAILDNDEAVTLTSCTVSNNATNLDGGGVYVTAAAGSLNLIDCIFSGNSAMTNTSSGGAVYVKSASAVSVTRCTISGNSGARGGGGIYFFSAGGSLLLTQTTISGNQSNTLQTGGINGGGGLYLRGTMATIRASTISGNSAYRGGGIYVSSTSVLTVENTTIAFNSVKTNGGGIGQIGTGTMSISSSLIANNVAATGLDVSGIATANFSLFGTSAGATITGANNVINVDPKLGQLTNNGGPTFTHALLIGSPAINAGSNPNNQTTDQRGVGFARSVGGQADIGAFEVQSAPPRALSIQVNDGSAQRSIVRSFKVAFSESVVFPSGVAAAFDLQRTGPNAPTGSINLNAVQMGNEVEITFTGDGPVGIDPGGSLQDGSYLLTILGSKVLGVGGQLDGDGNGTAGDNFSLALYRLFGDSNGDGRVDSIDLAALRASFGAASPVFDFNNDGQTNSTDFVEFRKRFGITLP